VVEPVIIKALAATTECVPKKAAFSRSGPTVMVNELLDAVQRAPAVVQSYQSRLTQRVQQALSELNVTVEPADLLREVSLFADRSDISEEIIRLGSHLQQYDDALRLPESSGGSSGHRGKWARSHDRLQPTTRTFRTSSTSRRWSGFGSRFRT
jgi:hypothetical protein